MANTKVSLKAVVPTKDVIDTKQLLGVIKGAAVETARGMRADFLKTTRTWKHRVVFTIQITVDGNAQATVYTDDDIYNYVNGGTKPHMIKPRRKKRLAFGVPFRAKTRVGFLGSGNGKRGNTMVFSKGVMHPGTDARNFDKVIADKWQTPYEQLMQRRVDNAIDARG